MKEVSLSVEYEAERLLKAFYRDDPPHVLRKALDYVNAVMGEVPPTAERIGEIGLDADERLNVAWICVAAGYPANCWV